MPVRVEMKRPMATRRKKIFIGRWVFSGGAGGLGASGLGASDAGRGLRTGTVVV